MPIVSVVLPVRDGAPYIAASIESILNQTLSDLELIVVDDGSRDQSPEIIAQIAARDGRIRVLRQEGAGIVPALQAALAVAEAELVARMDADDLALPERLERQLSALRNHPQSAVVGAACELIDRRGMPLRQQQYPTSPEAIRKALSSGNCIAHPTVLMRKKAVLDVGGYRAQFLLCEDYDLWLRLSEHYDLLNLPEPLLKYRVHPGQTTWRSHEQRIVSELAALACARARRAGRPEPQLPKGPVDRPFLLSTGLTLDQLAQEIAQRSLAAARGAASLDLPASALQALALALIQPGLGLRFRARALREILPLILRPHRS
jgi:glycosyltransferase involved in cell wall biosynthesis